jgi:hypothetical protein
MQKNDYSKLRECPFCGGKAVIQTSVSNAIPKCPTAICYCEKCKASGKWFEDVNCDGTFIDKAIEAWNRRIDDD